MENQFHEIMSQEPDKALIRMLAFKKEEYQPEALIAAKQELDKRNLSAATFDDISGEIELEINLEKAKAAAPLGLFWKILAFVFPGLITLAFSGSFRSEGYERKAKELLKWTVYGFGLYAVLIAILMMVNPLTD